MFWGPSVWAGLRAGDAGNAEEELGVQQNTSSKTHSAAGLVQVLGFVLDRRFFSTSGTPAYMQPAKFIKGILSMG